MSKATYQANITSNWVICTECGAMGIGRSYIGGDCQCGHKYEELNPITLAKAKSSPSPTEEFVKSFITTYEGNNKKLFESDVRIFYKKAKKIFPNE